MTSFNAHAMPSDDDHEGSNLTLASALQALIKTPAMRETLSILIPEVVQLWAGDHRLKNKITGPIGKSIQQGLRPESSRDEAHADSVMPEIITYLMAALEAAAQAFEGFSPEEKEKQLKAFFAHFGTGQTGRILTLAMQALHDLHGVNPTALADAMTPAL